MQPASHNLEFGFREAEERIYNCCIWPCLTCSFVLFRFLARKMRLILYSKPGCHLCEGLQEKLEQIIETRNSASLQLEIRDITSCEDWLQAYQYEVPVLFVDAMGRELLLPRPSPRATLKQLEQMLEKYK